MIEGVYALSYQEMEDLLQAQSDVFAENCFISVIGTNGTRMFLKDRDAILTVYFDDVLPAEVAAESCHGLSRWMVFSPAQADTIIDFIVRNHENRLPARLYIHCSAGVSRSGALATFANEILNLDNECFVSNNPRINPNPHVIGILRDQWLNRSLKDPE